MAHHAMRDAEQAQQFFERGEKWLNDNDSSGKPIPALLRTEAKQLFSEAADGKGFPANQRSNNNVNRRTKERPVRPRRQPQSSPAQYITRAACSARPG